VQDLPEIFDSTILVAYRDGRARIGSIERHARTFFKIDQKQLTKSSGTDFPGLKAKAVPNAI
jgi:hypothetical protein